MTDHVMAKRHDEAIQSRAQLLKPVQSKSLPALLDRHSLRPRDDGTCHGEEGRRSHPVRSEMVNPCSSKACRLYWLATACGLAMMEDVMARRDDEAIQSSAQ